MLTDRNAVIEECADVCDEYQRRNSPWTATGKVLGQLIRNLKTPRAIEAEVLQSCRAQNAIHAPQQGLHSIEATQAQEPVAERIAQITAHRACCGTEHDPANGKLHGYCVVCGVPWPCDYAGTPPQQPAPCPAPLDESRYCPDCDALQAKIADLEQKLKYSGMAATAEARRGDELQAKVAELKEKMFSESAEFVHFMQIDHPKALGERDATIAQQAERIAELEQQCSDLEGERDDAENQPWPEWSESILKIIRKRSGYDGFDDSDGIDLPEELRELLAGNDAEFDREHAKLVTATERIAEQSALIEHCETALILHEKLTRPIHSTTFALAEIAAHRGQS